MIFRLLWYLVYRAVGAHTVKEESLDSLDQFIKQEAEKFDAG